MISFLIKTLLIPALIILMATQQSPVESIILADGPVKISNKIQGPLTIHCVSNTGKDLGLQTRQFNEEFSWSVQLVVGRKGYEVFRCDLASGLLHGSFVLFDGSRDFTPQRCGLKDFGCYWQVRPDGIYLYHSKGDEHYFDLQYSWPR